ncbi:hypothetical protein NC653_018396 [Populus alba x Populus x berolinensis]|uniref:Serine protease EDA2 n=1 Tax=Populus alba x Populus x berolinensis TaxID=444605 RepID=A0AAD6QGD2_9ROSI|nr:hypothetical protein NC653_018396 [Populus alba x Populus x berolinensis]
MLEHSVQWFRLKFPHLTCGSLASSAVVLAIHNFTEFDQQCVEFWIMLGIFDRRPFLSLSILLRLVSQLVLNVKLHCKKLLKLVEERLASNKQAVKTLFDAAELEIDGGLPVFSGRCSCYSSVVLSQFQYGNPDIVCSTLVKAKNNGDDLVEAYAKYVKEYYLGTFGSTVQTYNQKYLKDTSLNKHTGDRLWWFQVCTEVAYFQVAPSNDSIRSSKVDARHALNYLPYTNMLLQVSLDSPYAFYYHLDLCKNVFGEGIYPEVDVTNIYYGRHQYFRFKNCFCKWVSRSLAAMRRNRPHPRIVSFQLFVENLILENGGKSNCFVPSFLISCHNCGHCTDIRGCPQTPLSLEAPLKQLNKVRHQIIEKMDLWLSECRAGQEEKTARRSNGNDETGFHVHVSLFPAFLNISCLSRTSITISFNNGIMRFLDYFRMPDGPIFLKICGESSCDGIANGLYRLLQLFLLFTNYTEFDQQIGESAGAECKAALQETTQLVEERLASNKKAVKTLFDAAELEIDGDFLYFLADAAAIAFQYGNPDKLCSPLVQAKKDGEDLVEAYAKYVTEYYVGSFGVSIRTYDQRHLKDTTLNENTGDRLWWFQVCTEVAYFQVAPANDSIRSSQVDTRYHLDLCKKVFGEGTYPEVDKTNIYYGGTNIAGSRIVFTNGSQDPWRHASKKISSPDMPSFVMSCHNCGHGTDMRGCPQSPFNIEGNARNCGSPDAVEKVRHQIIEKMDLWLSECHASGRSSM